MISRKFQQNSGVIKRRQMQMIQLKKNSIVEMTDEIISEFDRRSIVQQRGNQSGEKKRMNIISETCEAIIYPTCLMSETKIKGERVKLRVFKSVLAKTS
jgi:hypothetical protein